MLKNRDSIKKIFSEITHCTEIPLTLHFCVEVFIDGTWVTDREIEEIETQDSVLVPDYPEWVERDNFDLLYFLTQIQIEPPYTISQPLESPRGLPVDITPELKRFCEVVKAPIYSWFTLQEITDGIKQNQTLGTVSSHLFPRFQKILKSIRENHPQSSDNDLRVIIWYE